MRAGFDTRMLLVFGLAFLVAALTNWTVPYEDLGLMEDGSALRWAFYAAVLSLISHFRHNQLSGKVAIWIAMGFVTAVILRIVFDIFNDSSTHNLWPFEVVLALGITFAPAFVVGLVFKVVQRTLKGENH
ncbi:hypothetical protein [Cecembia rubra]|uniref:Uncharacterized protein n=1 Tax=Cecembia rubra TaxID=1485585 RepID=A0A2P8DWY1_9BACT|nr:hypothetical protein [Cecembia rubra]PSL01723.1 hypothetical protein CLV48_11266 [Cecembia rubra]